MPVAYQSVIPVNPLHCHAPGFDRDLRPLANFNMAHYRIAVQPPSQVQVGTPIPPVVATIRSRREHQGFYFFAMVVLIGSDGTILEVGLGGNLVSTGILLDDASSRSRRHVVFAFSDLSIAYEGTYSLRLDLYKVAYENPDGATLEEQIETTGITVLNTRVPRSRPCKLNNRKGRASANQSSVASDDRAFIRRLRDAGILS